MYRYIPELKPIEKGDQVSGLKAVSTFMNAAWKELCEKFPNRTPDQDEELIGNILTVTSYVWESHSPPYYENILQMKGTLHGIIEGDYFEQKWFPISYEKPSQQEQRNLWIAELHLCQEKTLEEARDIVKPVYIGEKL